MAPSEYETLNTGAKIPTIGLGTWKSQPGEVEKAVEVALRAGYRHIDTATAYGNEREVGAGIKASGVARDQFFLTTKLQETHMRDPPKALEFSLRELDTPYLDLWLMHWPAPMTEDGKADKGCDWLDAWKSMVQLYKAHPDKIKAIGVSNFSVMYLERLLKNSDVVPAVNQIELHAACLQPEVVAFCRDKHILLTAYSPLGVGSKKSPLLGHAAVKAIAERHGTAPANVLVSLWAGMPGVAVLTKSVTPARIKANLSVVSLDEKEVNELRAIDETEHFRVCHPSWTGWGSLGFPDCEKNEDEPYF